MTRELLSRIRQGSSWDGAGVDVWEDADRFYFRAETNTRTVTLRNRGSGENVQVILKSSEVVLDKKTIFVGEGQEKTVEFTGEYTLMGATWEIELSEPTSE